MEDSSILSEQDKISVVKDAIRQFYEYDIDLIKKGLCERCLVHRIAVYLEKNPSLTGYHIDCEFNKEFLDDVVSDKVVSNVNGNYIDIIVHKRSNNEGENLFCFEVKRADSREDKEKDRENLRILTNENEFAYTMGFYIILGSTYNSTVLEMYEEGRLSRIIPMGDNSDYAE